jgi:hypothetical protein
MRAEDFFARKIRRLRLGLNPRTWVPKASTLPLDHWSRLNNPLSYNLYFIPPCAVIHRCTKFTPEQMWRHAHSHRPFGSHHYSVPLRSLVFKLPLPMAIKCSTNSAAWDDWLHVSWFLFPLTENNEGAILCDICRFESWFQLFEVLIRELMIRRPTITFIVTNP